MSGPVLAADVRQLFAMLPPPKIVTAVKPRLEASPLKPSTAKHPLAWLDKQSAFQDLSVQASRLAELQSLLDQYAPIQGLKVKSLQNSILSIDASNASIAAKFRQFEPTVVASLAERGWKVIRIKVRPQLYTNDFPTVATGTTTARQLSTVALNSLRDLAAKTVSPKLKSALTHLLERRHD
jgi:hypothetical protein